MNDLILPDRSPHSPANAAGPGRFDAARPGAPEPYDQDGPGGTLHLREVLGVLRRHLLLVFAITALCTAAAAWLAVQAVPQYQARAVLRVMDERQVLSGGLDATAMEQVMGKQVDPLLSQMQVLRSRAVVGQVIDQLGLRLQVVEGQLPRRLLSSVQVASDATRDTMDLRFGEREFVLARGSTEVRAAYGSPAELAGVRVTVAERSEGGPVRIATIDRDRAIDALIGSLRARQKERTDIVDLELVSPDPYLAQLVVNTTAEAFRARSVTAAQQQSRRRREFVEARLHEADSAMAQAQQALSAFQSREQVFSSTEKFSAQQAGMMELEVRREEMEAERRMYQSLLDGLRRARAEGSGDALRALVSSPGVAANPVVGPLYSQLVRYEMSRDSMVAGGTSRTNADFERLTALVTSTEARLVAAVGSHVQSLQARITALDGMRARNGAQLRTLPAAQAEEARLVQHVQTVGKTVDQLREEAQKARIAEAIEAGQVEVVDLAPLPTEPLGSGRGFRIILGLVLGLMLGGGAAFMVEHMNTAVRQRDDLETGLHLPVLAVIPRMEGIDRGKKALPLALRIVGVEGASRAPAPFAGVVTMNDVHGAAAEAFRALRTNLIFSHSAEALRMLVVTSSGPGEGKTTTAANLAVAFAQQGMRVLLVDCDLRRPRIHSLFGVPKEPGLTQLVLGHNTGAEVLCESPVPGLSLLASGTQPPNPAELLGGAGFRAALDRLGEGFDMVVLDTPPLMAASDAAILAARADGVLFVVRAGHTDRDAALHSAQQLRTVGARIVGAVLNDPDAKVPAYGGYSYAYAYGRSDRAGS
ncbi:MAG: polysaccharide biosynthesis tyrosine autokinase [Gemmatimonadetes bacterium]|nr:polysaccharide biosynthesis tyrosine autokinase [Gemmatimonadota bacterium]